MDEGRTGEEEEHVRTLDKRKGSFQAGTGSAMIDDASSRGSFLG